MRELLFVETDLNYKLEVGLKGLWTHLNRLTCMKIMKRINDSKNLEVFTSTGF